MVDDNHSGGSGPLDAETTGDGTQPESLMPYDLWTEQALRHVVVSALSHVALDGLPGDHHFYLTFRTDMPGVVVPPRLRAQYPQEMTIVLQHQFWGLSVDPASHLISVGLSFGGVPSTLQIPLAAVTGFADPHVRFGLRFRPAEPEAVAAVPSLTGPGGPSDGPGEPADEGDDAPAADPTPQVVSLDAFRRRSPPKDGA